MLDRVRRWLGHDGEPWRRPPTGHNGPVEVHRATHLEIALLRRAMAIPPRLAGRYRREITGKILRLQRADRDYRMHQLAGEERPGARGASARRLSTRQVLLLDVLIMFIDSVFYYSTILGVIPDTGLLKVAVAALAALAAPLIVIVAARHLGGELRELQDSRKAGGPAERAPRGVLRKAPLSVLTLVLIAFVSLLLVVMSITRFTRDAAWDGGLDPLQTATALALGLVFVAVPAFAVTVHAMHDPQHRADTLRHSRKTVRLAAAHEHAWDALLGVAQKMMRETTDIQLAIDEHLSVGRAGDPAMGAHPPARAPGRARPGSSMYERFAKVWPMVGQEPDPIVESDPLAYNWTAFYEILTALDHYPPPPRSSGPEQTSSLPPGPAFVVPPVPNGIRKSDDDRPSAAGPQA
ncbi:hypothetical protein [Streptosporangium sp. H16]|uniref:hypothetical protein n=1 Tax=Streptosporangium sp. H16 TaxID=3444184 RepID=UPI003F7AE10D